MGRGSRNAVSITVAGNCPQPYAAGRYSALRKRIAYLPDDLLRVHITGVRTQATPAGARSGSGGDDFLDAVSSAGALLPRCRLLAKLLQQVVELRQQTVGPL